VQRGIRSARNIKEGIENIDRLANAGRTEQGLSSAVNRRPIPRARRRNWERKRRQKTPRLNPLLCPSRHLSSGRNCSSEVSDFQTRYWKRETLQANP